MTEPALMPAGFFGHGSPMNTLDHNRYTDAWRLFGTCVPRPRAVLVISAHWYTNATAVTAMGQPAPSTTPSASTVPTSTTNAPQPGCRDPEVAPTDESNT